MDLRGQSAELIIFLGIAIAENNDRSTSRKEIIR